MVIIYLHLIVSGALLVLWIFNFSVKPKVNVEESTYSETVNPTQPAILAPKERCPKSYDWEIRRLGNEVERRS